MSWSAKAPTKLGRYSVRIKNRPDEFVANLSQNDSAGFQLVLSRRDGRDVRWWLITEARFGLLWGDGILEGAK